MIRTVVVRKNRYYDSIFLMGVARRIASEPGIADAYALLATPANRKALSELGYGDGGRDADYAAAGPNDLLFALEGEAEAVAAIAARVDTYLSTGASPPSRPGQPIEPRSIAEAVAARPDCSVAVISVPGEFAVREARTALQNGLHVFLFSSNVSVADERALKTEARQRGLIVMGPDCGTGYLGGAGIGFANAVRRGPIGIVGSTGTGMQEFASLIHRAGSGISNGVGTGSRDLSDAVGGISTMTAIDALEADPATKVIAVMSKPPGAAATAMLEQRLGRCTKPVVLCLLGAERGRRNARPASDAAREQAQIGSAFTIDEAVELSLRAIGKTTPPFLLFDEDAMRETAAAEIGKMHPRQRHVRGLFVGGTLCYQAQDIFLRSGLAVHSNAPMPGASQLADPDQSRDTTFVDMGAESFVQGRPHPMIDGSQRRKRLEREGKDPAAAVILLDFVLGAIASRDPVGEMLGTLRDIKEAARAGGNHLCIAASVCGTEEDRQGLDGQKRALTEAGVIVFPSSAQAAAFCREAARLLERREVAG